MVSNAFFQVILHKTEKHTIFSWSPPTHVGKATLKKTNPILSDDFIFQNIFFFFPP